MFKSEDPGYQAFRILQIAFVIVPLIAGLDKFFYLLDDWSHYLAPMLYRFLLPHVRGFMAVVGVIEIVAGIGVIFKPRLFAYVVSAWLLLIVLNLCAAGIELDVALRDFGLMLSAFALAKLSQRYTTRPA